MSYDLAKLKQDFFQKHYVEQSGESNEKAPEKLKRLQQDWMLLEKEYLAQNAALSKENQTPLKVEGANSWQSQEKFSTPNREGVVQPGSPTTRNAQPSKNFERTGDDLRIDEVTLIGHNEEFDWVASTDGELKKGSFHFMDGLFLFSVFSRNTTETTYLHVYGVSSERNVRLRIKRGHFDAVADLEIASLFFEPPPEEAKDSFASSWGNIFEENASLERGYPVEKVPILTGTSELDDDDPITVYEEPQGYNQLPKNLDTVKSGMHTTADGKDLLYRAFSISTSTKIIVREISTGRKLFFTVYRSSFVEEEDMRIASFFLGNVRARTPTFRPAVKTEDMERVMNAYSSPERAFSSPKAQGFSQPPTPIENSPVVLSQSLKENILKDVIKEEVSVVIDDDDNPLSTENYRSKMERASRSAGSTRKLPPGATYTYSHSFIPHTYRPLHRPSQEPLTNNNFTPHTSIL